MGWITLSLCVGMRIDLAKTSLKSLEELCSLLTNIVSDTASDHHTVIQDLQVSSLKTNFEGTEFEGIDPDFSNFDRETFGELDAKDNCYMLYFNAVQLDSSNGDTLNTNNVYSSGHVEFYHGTLKHNLDPTDKQRDLFREIARRANMPFDQLDWSLRARGSWAKTIVWRPHNAST